jgi:hypothetical protein
VRIVEFRRLFDDKNAARVRFELERNQVLRMAGAKVTPQTKKPKNVVQRNITLLEDLMRYLLAKPQILDSLPDNFELVILPDDDPEMRLYNLDLLDTYGSDGKSIVFVRMKSSREADDHARPSLYVPLVA